MNEFEHPVLKETYQKLYAEYESLIRDMRLYWEEHYNKNSYHNEFINIFSHKKDSITTIITKNLSNLEQEFRISIPTKEVKIFAQDLYRLSKNINFHYHHYHVSKIPV